ncbi:MAG: hypothetical protein ACRELY_16735 [Polyangiaceae bacterium]
MIRAARGAGDALFASSMLPRLEYLDDEVDDDITRMLREVEHEEAWEDDPFVETQLMPAKHGAKSPTLASHDRLAVPSPYPSSPKQHPSGARKMATRPSASKESEPPALFAELYSAVESTGSDIHALVHHLDGSGPVLPSTTKLAARRSPWKIQVTPPEFEPFAMPMFQPPGTHVVQKKKKRSHKGSAIVGGLLGIVCGFLVVSVAKGTITAKDARTVLARGAHVVDAVLAYH